MSTVRDAISALQLAGFKAEADAVSQLCGTANQLREESDTLRARVACLDSSLDVQTQLLASATEQLNAMHADRDRYKAWHDDVASRRLHVLQENGRVYDAIVRPKPLKENE